MFEKLKKNTCVKEITCVNIILVIILLAMTNCGDKDTFLSMGPSYDEGSSIYEFYNVWGKDYQAEVGPGHGDGTSTSTIGGFKQPMGIFIKEVTGKAAVYVVDTGNNRIEKFYTTGDIFGWNAGGSIGSEGNNDGKFEEPTGIFVDASNNMFIADKYNGRVQKFNSDGTFVLKIGDYNTNILIQPIGVVCDNSGNIYILDTIGNHIKKFNSTGTYQTTFGEFNNPSDIYIYDNELYISDTGNHRIVKYDITGNLKTSIGNFGFRVQDLNEPKGLCVDKNYIYVVDGNYIKVFSMAGVFVTYIGGGRGKGKGLFYNPYDVAVDSAGNLYITDSDNNRIQVFNKK